MDDPRMEVFRLVGGYMTTRALGAVVECGLADAVGDDPVPVDRLAAVTGIPVERLDRFLRALWTVGLFAPTSRGVVHTEASRLLRRDHELTMAPHVGIHLDRGYDAWTGLLESLRDGDPAFERQRGVPMFDWLEGHPDEAHTFNDAMAVGSRLRRRLLLDRDWSRASHVVDVGGGTGTNLLAVLAAHPHLTGTVVDLPGVGTELAAAIEESGLGDRCDFAPGSFFDSVPSADTYVLAVVLHDWDDEHAGSILGTCRAAAPEGAALVLVETVLEEPQEWDWGPWMDLHMLVMLGGQERSEAQWRALLERSGWSVREVRPGLVEAVAAPG